MYRDKLRVYEPKFSQPHTVVSANLEILNSIPPMKTYKFERTTSFPGDTSILIDVFRLLSNEDDLKENAILNQVLKLPPNMKKS